MASIKKLILEYYTYPNKDNEIIKEGYTPVFLGYPILYEHSIDFQEINDDKLKELVHLKILDDKELVKNLIEKTIKLCCYKSELINDKKKHIEIIILY
jgi:hypothetical protein